MLCGAPVGTGEAGALAAVVERVLCKVAAACGIAVQPGCGDVEVLPWGRQQRERNAEEVVPQNCVRAFTRWFLCLLLLPVISNKLTQSVQWERLCKGSCARMALTEIEKSLKQKLLVFCHLRNEHSSVLSQEK